ncbi:Hsp70 family protein [Streptomyces antibioticus]|uniref:Hsp70 family protein n=1 Tax=Streptomyces antibioticus TaxID=1890 RepID=UPI003721C64E
MARLGIDIGTWSLAAVLQDSGGLRLVPDPDSGQLWVRSGIARGPQGGWLLGGAAEQIRGARPDLYRDDVKRLLDSDRPVYLAGAPFQAVEPLTHVISHCLSQAGELTDECIEELVLGVPVAFEGSRADALRAAARGAGFAGRRVRLVPEPVAAARAALGDGQEPGTWLVFDLGGGTLDLALVRTDTDGALTVLDTAGDAGIGGHLLDEAIAEHLRTVGGLPAPGESEDDWEEGELTQAARSLKHQLSSSRIAYARSPYRTGPRQLTLTADDLTELAKPVADAALRRSEDLLTANGLTWDAVTAVISTGGATRIPATVAALSLHALVRQGPHPPELATAHGLLADAYDVPGGTTSDGRETGSATATCRTLIREDPSAVRRLHTLTGHTDLVRNVTFSPDGNLIATTSTDTTVRVWNLATRTGQATLTGHTDAVWGVAFSPDGNLIATTGGDKTLRIWNLASGTCRVSRTEHTDLGVAFSPDGRLLATAGTDATVRLLDLATGAPHATLTGHTDWVWGVAFSPDGTLLATTSDDKSVRIWNLATHTAVATLTGHTGRVQGVAFSPDGSLLATTGGDTTVRIWNVATLTANATLSGHTEWVWGVAFSPDGTLLATSGDDATVRIWDVAAQTARAVLIHPSTRVQGVAFSPDGTLLATTSDDTTVGIWGAG